VSGSNLSTLTPAAKRMLDDSTIEDVQTHNVSARLVRRGAVTDVTSQLNMLFATADQQIFYRFDMTCDLEDRTTAAEEARLAELKVSIATIFRTQATNPSDEVIREFGEQVAEGIAYPYIRETIQALGARLGFPDVTLSLARKSLAYLPPTTAHQIEDEEL
jgi:preprotein translocase subunit SecB